MQCRTVIAAFAALAALSSGALAQPAPSCPANRINFSMFLASKPQDGAACAMMVRDGKIVVTPPTTNPAMSCPDMFGWKMFSEVVKQEFWKSWASDPDTWPGDPLPLCQPGAPAGTCCTPGAADNPGYSDSKAPANNCPFFPGDHRTPAQVMQLRIGQPPSKSHLFGFSARPQARATAPAPGSAVDPGRVIRQSMAELVFRNKPMFDFVFRNDLYHQQGLQRLFKRNDDYLKTRNTPYRPASRPGALTEIDFPVDALMIKSNWLSEARAREIGLREDPNNPYIKMTILTPVDDNNADIFQPGVHWLVAFHVSSKDTPNWVWATFEHANNPGRCDYTGCNDSYGYRTADNVTADQATNFTTPHVVCDGLLEGSWIFDNGKPYPEPGSTRSTALAAIFRGLNIGNADATAPGSDGTLIPSSTDRAWLSYRLKGSQTQFTDATGLATKLGNSVTEGGFVNTSSCITCHARAGTSSRGSIPPALSVFMNQLSETGYLQSANGSPVPEWYWASRQPSSGPPPARSPLEVVQTDFVWGFLAASCIKSQPTEGCSAAAPAVTTLLRATPAARAAAGERAPRPHTIRERIRED
jgi:hypothetical protein